MSPASGFDAGVGCYGKSSNRHGERRCEDEGLAFADLTPFYLLLLAVLQLDSFVVLMEPLVTDTHTPSGM